ncbi:MAG TPA: helix-turn-helix domain-containing protein [Verrucomicrobiae bacterium]|nr:helix-turn-helix domain-containing protein [Verrucomicrobiae bacterium]
MNSTTLIWRERTTELEAIASVWTCNASEITSRTVLADPCISIILVKSADSTEVILRGPETKPRGEVLLPGYTWTAIRLQPGVVLRNFPAEQFTDSFLTLPADNEARFLFEGMWLQFPDFRHAEQLVMQMQNLGLISGKPLSSEKIPLQGMSSKSYSRLVKRTTGLSPYKLRQLQRIHQALQLLKQGVPAAAVAADLGFVDQAHLVRAAKQFLGHTPKELLHLPQSP